MSNTPATDWYQDDGPDDDCWQCGGDGGWNSCMEDTCCAIGGEEGCDDPLCWRRCDICRGKGHLRAEPAAGSPQTDDGVNK